MSWGEAAVRAQAKAADENARRKAEEEAEEEADQSISPIDWDDPRRAAVNPGIVSRTIVGPGGEIELHNDPIFIYNGGDGQNYWDSYGPETQDRLLGQLKSAGLVPESTMSGASATLGTAWEQVLGWANEWAVTPFNAIHRLDAEGIYRDGGGGGGGGGGAARAPVIEIPDYPTIAQKSKEMVRTMMGRKVEDFEVAMVGAEMQKQYRKWAEVQTQKQLSGGGTFEVNDPVTMTKSFVEDQYAGEITRLKQTADTQQNNGLAMQVLTQGARMVGG